MTFGGLSSYKSFYSRDEVTPGSEINVKIIGKNLALVGHIGICLDSYSEKIVHLIPDIISDEQLTIDTTFSE